ncbi:MAG: FUSC family protein [Xanthobacteraceae bacterium]
MDHSSQWQSVLGAVRAYRAPLRFCLRVTAAGLAAFAIGQVLALPLHGLWVVLTAIVVMQTSAGGSLRATVDYLIGTLCGAVYAALIGVLIPHETELAQAGILALAIVPLALTAAIKPSFRVAPFSAVLVLLISGGPGGQGPIQSAIARFSQVALGGAIAVAISLLVFPERANRLGLQAAAGILDQFAGVLAAFFAGFARQLDANEIRRMQDELGAAVAHFQAIAAEARHERFVRLMAEPDPAPLSRALLRLRHDLIIIGRAANAPFPETIAPRLEPRLSRLGAEAGKFLHGSATALAGRRRPPVLEAVDSALEGYMSEIAALRGEGLTRPLTSPQLEQLFALSFALEQMRQNFSDLQRCAREYARKSGRRGAR